MATAFCFFRVAKGWPGMGNEFHSDEVSCSARVLAGPWVSLRVCRDLSCSGAHRSESLLLRLERAFWRDARAWRIANPCGKLAIRTHFEYNCT